MSQATIEKKVTGLPARFGVAGRGLAKADYCRATAGRDGAHGQSHQTARGVARALCGAWQRSLCHRGVFGQTRVNGTFAVRRLESAQDETGR